MSEYLLSINEKRAALDLLIEFASIPNIVSDADAIDQNAHYLLELLGRLGMRVEKITAGGAPYVFGEYFVSDALPTVLFYSHFDGVPVEPVQWSYPPFSPTLRPQGSSPSTIDQVADDTRLFARSVADSKNSIVALATALGRVTNSGQPAVNVKFLLDGEEERESPSLGELVRKYEEKIGADILVSASGEVHQSGLPTVAFGVRGALTIELVVHTASSDLHSGHFGNFAPNAALKLSRLLAALKDDDGRVTVPGFYDDVRRITDFERDLFSRIPRIEGAVKDLFGISEAEVPHSSLQELINMPTLNIRGLRSGHVGGEARNIIPSTAAASLDIRLVADMNADRVTQLLANWLRDNGWTVLHQQPKRELLRKNLDIVELRVGEGFPATRSNPTGPFAEYVTNAVREASWTPQVVVEPTEGGSLKHHLFTDLGMEYVALPTSNFDNNQHTHDENLQLRYFWYGIRLFEALLRTRPRSLAVP